MGVFIKGESLDLGASAYKLQSETVYNKVTKSQSNKPLTPFAHGYLGVGENVSVTIATKNLLVTNDIYAPVMSVAPIDNLDVSLFSLEDACIVYVDDRNMETFNISLLKYDDYKHVFNITFELDSSKENLIMRTYKIGAGAPGEFDYTSGGELVHAACIMYIGVWGVLKYNGQYVLLNASNVVKFGGSSVDNVAFNKPSFTKTINIDIPVIETNLVTVNNDDVEVVSGDELPKESVKTVGYLATSFLDGGFSNVSKNTILSGTGFVPIVTLQTVTNANRRIINV